MIDNLISFSIRNKLIIGIFTLALVVWGAYSLTRLPIDAVPDITNNQVQIITSAPTLAAQEVEQFITYPVEIAMANIPKVIEIRSISRFGLSVVTVVFEDDADIYWARQLVGEKIKIAQDQIPKGLGNPDMAPISTGLGEIYQYVLVPKPGYEKKYSASDLRTIQDWIVKRQLAGTEGLAEVSSFGGYVKQYEVAIDPDKLRAHNVTVSDVFTALEKNNQNTGGAYIEKGHNAYFIRGVGLVSGLEDVGKIVVAQKDNVPLLIRDVANVQFGSAVRYGAMTRNGKGEVVGGIVLMLKGENSAQVIERVKQRVEEIKKSLPEGVALEAFIDRTRLVNKAIGTVEKNLIEGGLIVIFILVLFLGNLRAGLVVASVIPLAMLFAVCMMNLFGVSGNLMSLGAIDFGLIVDGAVIIVESIVHRIHHDYLGSNIKKLNQDQMDDVVHDASIKIRQSAAFGEIIILIVYLPILSLVGIEGKMFKPMAQTVGFAILGALILSLTYVPMASAAFLSKKAFHKKNISDKMMDFMQKIYNPIIRKALKARMLVLSLSVGLLVISFFIFSRMGGEFIPTLEEGDLAATATISPGSSLSQTVQTATRMEQILLKKFPEVKEVITKIGAAEIPTDPMPVEAADMIIVLKEKDEWVTTDSREDLSEMMKEALEAIPGVNFEFSQPIQLRFNELMTGVRSDIAVKIYGEDLDVLAQKAAEAQAIITPIKGVGDLRVEQVKGLPQIMVTYNKDKIAQYGLSIEEVNTVLKTAFAGGVAGVVFEGQKRFDMVVRLDTIHRKDIDNVRNLFIPLSNGAQVPLAELANIEYKEGPMQVSRDKTKRRITLGINVRDRDVESLVGEIQKKLDANLKLPAGYHITYGGQFENLKEGKKRLSVAVPVALALILLLLFFTFGSIKQSLLIFTAIPLAAIGGIFALLFRGMPFSISAGIGFIALFGVAVLNGIVLIGYFNQLKKEGITDVYQRILKGTEVRLRPVLMTAAVASLGFLPMALSNSSGAEVQKPLATVVIGGLITSTLLTLIVLPVLYSFIEKMKTNKNSNLSTGTAVVIIFILSAITLPNISNAQSQTIPNVLTLQQAINTGLTNNPNVKSATYVIEQQTALKRTGFDLGRTVVSLTYGQYNSLYKDNNIGILQSFAFPTVYRNYVALSKEQIAGAEFSAAMTRTELIRNIKFSYYQLLVINERKKFLLYQDSVYSDFSKAAELRFTTGESSYLEKITAETRLMEVRNQLVQVEADLSIYKNQIQKLLNSNQDFSVSGDIPVIYDFALPGDTVTLEQNPTLNYYKQQIAINHAQKKLERSRLFPGISVGYNNQSLTGNYMVDGANQFYGTSKRFQYVFVGLDIPLWARPQAARVKAADLGEKAAASGYEFQKLYFQSQYETLVKEYEKYKATLNYYQQKAIPQAHLILDNSSRAFKAGEIGYVEFVQSITQAVDIKIAYLNAINQFNQTTINLQYILGGQQ
ncbi:MAG: CusA/CzcA family heavy metal efflux RND transporter [Cytophagaceae bacterium]|nr:CusA/CzcA family heavy metal efflux RND transporter [Cytophagaceae bacterium]